MTGARQIAGELLAWRVTHLRLGSRTAIAEFHRRPAPAVTPEAETMVRAHLGDLAGCGRRRMAKLVARALVADPRCHPASRARSTMLPFLVKVLAADEPPSLQAHPSAAGG